MSLSGDGRYVAFSSDASNLVSDDTNGTGDVFVRDLWAGTTMRSSVDSAGTQGNSSSGSPSLSGDGRYVAFQSSATNLFSGDSNGKSDIFVKDLSTGVITLVSTDSAGTQGNGSSGSPSLSDDGRYVAFWSLASNLVPGDTNGKSDIFVKDLLTGVTTRVSTNSVGTQANDTSDSPSLSDDGRYVAFRSDASNLISGDTNARPDIFVKDLSTGVITLVSTDSEGVQANNNSYSPSVSSDGRYVAFSSYANNLISGDSNGTEDAFVKDLSTGVTILVGADSEGTQANDYASEPHLSGDGRYVVFSSSASNLVPGDTNGNWDIFVKDLSTGVTTLVSTDSAGTQGNSGSSSPSLSGDGRYVAFSSSATNLHPSDATHARDVFRVSIPVSPTGITLSAAAVAENLPTGTAVGLLSSAASFTSTSFTYSLVPGEGDADNASFTIEGDGLLTAASFDYETQSSYSIRVRTTDQLGLWYEEVLAISVTDLPDFDTPSLYDGGNSCFFLQNRNTTGFADLMFGYGAPGNWMPVAGHWQAGAADTIGLYDPDNLTFYLRHTNSGGYADLVFTFADAQPGWIPLAGDWDGDGVDTVGLYDPAGSHFHLRNSNTAGPTELDVAFGEPGGAWLPVAGHWNGPGPDSIGLYDPGSSSFYLNSGNHSGHADAIIGYGQPGAGWLPLAGDWGASGTTTIGLHDPSTGLFYLRNSNTPGYADLTFAYGPAGAGWQPLTGNWDGSGVFLLRATEVVTEAAAGVVRATEVVTEAAAGVLRATEPVTEPAAGVVSLTEADLLSVRDAAIARWAAQGLSASGLEAIARARLAVAELEGPALGATSAGTIYLDRTAAGHGWFLDPTPGVDEEFTAAGPSSLRALDPQAVGRIDLLTTLMHELGHVAGLGDLDASLDDVMSAILPASIRRLRS